MEQLWFAAEKRDTPSYPEEIMHTSRPHPRGLTVTSFAALMPVLTLVAPARAATYTDTASDQAGAPSNPNLDIGSAELTNDLVNLSIRIDLNSSIGSPSDWGNYLIGFDTVAGGKTTVGDPWGHPIGISSGLDHWIGSWVNFGGGAELHSWTGSAWGPTVPGTSVALTGTSTTITVPLALLGLNVGDTFIFDIWSTGGFSPNPAIDALSNPSQTQPTWVDNVPYDSGTLVSRYTVVPEPVSVAMAQAAMMSVLLLGRRRAR
jgi:hypothetical protein